MLAIVAIMTTSVSHAMAQSNDLIFENAKVHVASTREALELRAGHLFRGFELLSWGRARRAVA